MSDNDDSNKDMPIRKRASLVWQYFEKLSSVRVKCRICQHEQRYMGNTANALRHLKAKHDIDARPVGLTDPENVKRMKALSTSGLPFEQTMSAVSIKNECHFEDDEAVDDGDGEEEVGGKGRRQSSSGRLEEQNNRNHQQISFYDNEPVINPYINNEESLVDFADTKKSYLNNSKDEEDEPFIPIRNDVNRTESKRKRNLEDERIKAEIEYFREKAGYYRLQKHLTALQAKKVKFELEQMYGK